MGDRHCIPEGGGDLCIKIQTAKYEFSSRLTGCSYVEQHYRDRNLQFVGYTPEEVRQHRPNRWSFSKTLTNQGAGAAVYWDSDAHASGTDQQYGRASASEHSYFAHVDGPKVGILFE